MNLDKEVEARMATKKTVLKKKLVQANRYRADITSGSLKVFETRQIAKLLLKNLNEDEWQRALIVENVLEVKSPKSAKNLSGLIRQRLEMFDQILWKMIASGGGRLATQACFAAAVKHSPLVGDFLLFVVKDNNKIGMHNFNNFMWEKYIQECHYREPVTPEWSSSTVKRLKSSVFQILNQVGFLTSNKDIKIQNVFFEKQLVDYLKERNEKYVLKCIEVLK